MLEDAHLHFFSKGVFGFYARQAESFREELDPASAAAAWIGVEAPPAEPEALAARWAAELDRHGVARALLFGSAPGEHNAVARAAKACPGRFVPFQMVNPRGADVVGVVRQLHELEIRGVLLFPAMHGYYPDDDACRTVYAAAREHGLVVFVHVGRLQVAIREKLGIRGGIEERFGDATRLGTMVRAYPEVPFIAPHFGCGTFDELLAAAAGARNLYLDTSSSNSWIADSRFPDLAAVFRAALDAPGVGPERLLFGSDSTVFPRGWRADVYGEQRAALEALGVSAAERDAIFGGNLQRLLPTV
jgi:predicted TIM-barrel fold metal-dependent hydrolase